MSGRAGVGCRASSQVNLLVNLFSKLYVTCTFILQWIAFIFVCVCGGGGGDWGRWRRCHVSYVTQGVHLILAYSWAKPAILVAGKGRGGNVFISSVSSLSIYLSIYPAYTLNWVLCAGVPATCGKRKGLKGSQGTCWHCRWSWQYGGFQDRSWEMSTSRYLGDHLHGLVVQHIGCWEGWSWSGDAYYLTLMPASVAQLDAPSNWRPGGRGINPRRGRQHSFVEIDHEIFSTVILSLPLIQEGQLSVSGERMCTILVNRLED